MKLNPRLPLLVSVFALLTLSGCIATGGDSLSARVDQHDQQILTLMSQVGQVEQVLPGQAEIWSQMQTMRQEVNLLKGRLEEQGGEGGDSGEVARLRDKVARLEAVVRQMAAQLGVNVDTLNVSDTGVSFQQPGQLQGMPDPQSSSMPQTLSAQAGATAGGQSAEEKAEALYNKGIKSFDQRNYKEAVAAFLEFTSAYPKHKLAGNAHFWAGESYFQIKDYARAAVSYDDVIKSFPGNPKIQDSMLKQGMSLFHAGYKPAAKQRLNELVARYPSSQQATRAKQFITTNKL